jgi:hypothetical protein
MNQVLNIQLTCKKINTQIKQSNNKKSRTTDPIQYLISESPEFKISNEKSTQSRKKYKTVQNHQQIKETRKRRSL